MNLHVFADSSEEVAMYLHDRDIACKLYERRLKTRRGRNAQPHVFPGYRFDYDGERIEATVGESCADDGIRRGLRGVGPYPINLEFERAGFLAFKACNLHPKNS